MASQYTLFSLLAVTAVATATAVKLAFTNQEDSHLSPDVDGPWPTIPLQYVDVNSNNGTLNTYLTFSNLSLLVRPQKCADYISNGTFLCNEFVYPDFYLGNEITNPTMINFDTGSILSVLGNNSITSTSHTGMDFSMFLALSGNFSGEALKADVGGAIVETPALVAENLTTLLSNSSRPIPLLNSMLSIPQYSAAISRSGAAVSQFSSFHTGSTDPLVNGTFIVGGYDNNRILGNLMNWSVGYDQFGDVEGFLTITQVNIGVESGFLPLDTLRLVNNSFPQGPYKQNVGYMHTGYENVQNTEVLIEPGSPYLHLSTESCDSLADILELTYDATRNLYLWSYPPDHPIFRSPVYLELIISSVENPDTYSPELLVKIPFALLQHTFHATTRAMNGTLLPPARYFPCSRREFDSYYLPSRLGRAFLQAAFVASSFQYPDSDYTTATYWLAQAPGPAAIDKDGEHIIEVESGYISNRTNVAVDANAWTKSWSGVLPIWTVNADGKTTLDQLNAAPEAENKAKELGIKVGIPVAGTVFAGVLLFFSIRGVRNSRNTRRCIERKIAEEDATAREIERLMVSEKELQPMLWRSGGERPSVGTGSSFSGEHMRRVSGSEEASLGIIEAEDTLIGTQVGTYLRT
ncbi:hypothetical protein F5B19DRAFT_214268 [Rostrohypoxylon terebratum]|nr:hypothetical protein F5B19DRAFT_214268 [Rostrohypoxylon terebratum]